MSTLLFVDPKISTHADGAQSSRVPVPLLGDPFEAIRQAYLVETDRDCAHDRACPACHVPGHSARVTEAMALSDSAFRKRYRSSYKTPSSSSSLAFPVRKRYRGTSEPILDTDSEEDEIGEEGTDEDGLDDEGHGLDDEGHSLDDEGRSVESDGLSLEGKEEVVPEGQQRAASVMETAVGEPLGLGYEALRFRELAVEEDQVYSTFEVGQGSGSVPEPERLERVSALRQPTLTTWIDPEDAPSAVPSPISSPMISLTVPSPVASQVATPTATIPVDEDQLIEIGAQLELYGGILQDHTQRLDTMPPTLVIRLAGMLGLGT
ncbi:hypothetical protein Tco_0269638 [Tanacetum coccineum]